MDVLGLEDLARSKKTQRDKDWFMLARLVENDMALAKRPPKRQVEWWLRECRNVETLIQLAERHRPTARELRAARPLLDLALRGKRELLEQRLAEEEEKERAADRGYWAPLKKELEVLRRRKRHTGTGQCQAGGKEGRRKGKEREKK